MSGKTKSKDVIAQCNGLKRYVESATGIIPGNRGKVDGSWCRHPLCTHIMRAKGIYHQLLSRFRDRL
jgi:hypothetical protein